MKRITIIVLLLLAAMVTVGCDKPPAKPITLFNGKDLTGWEPKGRLSRNFWKVGSATVDSNDPKKLAVKPGGQNLINAGIVGADLATKQSFGDAKIELEFMIPTNSNSGILVMGRYEVQIVHDPSIDTAKPGNMDIGAIARISAPKIYAGLEPGQWQKMTIQYRAPRFDSAGKKTTNMKFVRVELNGQVVQENVEADDLTTAVLFDKEAAVGPLTLQGSEGPIAFRNIVLTPLN